MAPATGLSVYLGYGRIVYIMNYDEINDLPDSAPPVVPEYSWRHDYSHVVGAIKAIKNKVDTLPAGEGGSLEIAGTPTSDSVVSYANGEPTWQKTGELAFASSNVVFVSSSGSPEAITGMNVTFATTDRPVNLTLAIPLAYSNGDGLAVIEIFDGTNVLASTPLLIRGNYGTVQVTTRIAAGTASKTYTGRFWRVSGAESFELNPSNPASTRYLQALTV